MPASGTSNVASGTPCADAASMVPLEKLLNTLVMKISENRTRPTGTRNRMEAVRCSYNARVTHATLEDVVRDPALALVDVIVQDEFTHDVIVKAKDGFLVFDTT